MINTLWPRQNGCNFANDTFNCAFLFEKGYILFQISLKFVHCGPNNNNIPVFRQWLGAEQVQTIDWIPDI